MQAVHRRNDLLSPAASPVREPRDVVQNRSTIDVLQQRSPGSFSSASSPHSQRRWSPAGSLVPDERLLPDRAAGAHGHGWGSSCASRLATGSPSDDGQAAAMRGMRERIAGLERDRQALLDKLAGAHEEIERRQVDHSRTVLALRMMGEQKDATIRGLQRRIATIEGRQRGHKEFYKQCAFIQGWVEQACEEMGLDASEASRMRASIASLAPVG